MSPAFVSPGPKTPDSTRRGGSAHRASIPWLCTPLRLAALVVAMSVASSHRASAQALGTVQVSARVLPASVSWSGVGEAARAAHDLLRHPAGGPVLRRSGLVRTRAVLEPAGGRQLLLVTIQHPYN
jgi:hypothetical protein